MLEDISDKIVVAELNQEKVLKGNPSIMTALAKPKINQSDFFNALSNGQLDLALKGFLSDDIVRKRSFCRKMWTLIRRVFRLRKVLLSAIRINGIRNVLRGFPLLICEGRVIMKRHPGAKVFIKGNTNIGSSLFGKKTKLESRVLLGDRSKLISYGYSFGYGCDIELFDGAVLEVGPGGYSNIGLTIICGQSIKMGEDVICGRHVTIRDTNGNHIINSSEYQTTKPVVIGDHVWLCERSIILPGVNIGSGSVVAAGAIVTHDVPANCLVAGVPAKVIRKDVQWRK